MDEHPVPREELVPIAVHQHALHHRLRQERQLCARATHVPPRTAAATAGQLVLPTKGREAPVQTGDKGNSRQERQRVRKGSRKQHLAWGTPPLSLAHPPHTQLSATWCIRRPQAGHCC
uniref:Uncharacterized protein n=1 Tax=Pelusios castaneus TaxID=367368 RepID=A0A8C8VGT4_9SAUR